MAEGMRQMSDELEIADDDRPSTTWCRKIGAFLTVRQERERIRAELLAELQTQQRQTPSAEHEADHESAEPEDARRRSRSRRRPAAAAEFNGPLICCQLKLPADLVSSLRLLAYDGGITMSELALKCLTSPETVAKCWLQKRAG
jgi:hypothetical protein